MTAALPREATAGTGLDALRGLALCRVDEVYENPPQVRERVGATEYDNDQPRRLAAVVSAFHAAIAAKRTPLVLGWVRPVAGGPVTVLASASASSGRAAGSGGPAALEFPPGSRGRAYPGDEAVARLSSLPCWTRIGAVVDGLLVEEAQRPGTDARPGLADTLLSAWHQPFAWLLVAEPVPPNDISTEAARVAAHERDARSRTSSPEYAVRAARFEHRHRELRAAESTGLWRVHLLAAGADAAATGAVAGLLCAATDLTGLPYTLVPTTEVHDLDKTLAVGAPHLAAATPFLATSALVAALARPPAVEIPGIRVVPRPTFDVTPEAAGGEAGVTLGEVVDRGGVPAGALRLPFSSLNRHTFVCGATGAGKSQTIRHLLEEASAVGLPWLVIEPAKAEYRRMAGRVPDAEVIVLRPGEPLAPPVGLNPLQPAAGFPLQTHADLTNALFVAAFQAEEPFPQVLAAALTRSYEQLGWDLTLGEPAHPGVRPRYPTLADLQATAEQVVDAIGYGREVTDNVRGFIRVRLASLRLGTTGRFFDGGQRLDLERLLRRNVILEIEDVGDDRDKAFLMGAVLIQLVEHLRVQDRTAPHAGGLRHLTVIEEAHRLLRRTEQPGPAAHAVELFAALLAEVRAYGEGLVIAEQIPAKLVPDVIKNTAVKVVHRLPAGDDRESVGATMNLTDEQSRFLVTLPPGTGAVFADGMDHPVLATMPDGTAREQDAGPAVGGVRSAAALIAQAAPACPVSCAVEPCSLRRMAGARRLLTLHPSLVAWAELAVLGHLTGLPAPVPGPRLAAEMADLDRRSLDCAVRHAVEAAIAARSAALVTSHSPDPFGAHIAAELRAQVAGISACPDDALDWVAPCFRWNPVRLALQSRYTAEPGAGRHPDSERWAARHGRPVDGANCWEQLTTVKRWCMELLADRPAVDAVMYGAGTPSALETAIGRARDADDWGDALARATAAFEVFRNWPAAFLAPT